MAARSAVVAASTLVRSSLRSPAPSLIARRGLSGGGGSILLSFSSPIHCPFDDFLIALGLILFVKSP